MNIAYRIYEIEGNFFLASFPSYEDALAYIIKYKPAKEVEIRKVFLP
jgi:hypothetical protein